MLQIPSNCDVPAIAILVSSVSKNAVYSSVDSIKDLVKPASESAGLMRIVSKNRRLAVTSNSIASSVPSANRTCVILADLQR